MKKLSNAAAVLLAALMLVPLAACGGREAPPTGDDGMADLSEKYAALEAAHPHTPDDKNSWEYIEDEDYTIDWYVDVSAWPAPAENEVTREIRRRTGITVNFETPVTDDGQKLATMIAGNDLPDVLSVNSMNTSMLAQLAQQGYVYDINGLADRWAPTLYDHLPQDVIDWWAFGNGKVYGVPNHYYSYEDVPDGQLQPNGGMMVRKDLFDEWQAIAESRADAEGNITYTGRDGTEKKVAWQGYITTPEGFKEAASWAIGKYYGNNKGQITTALQLGQFASNGCASLGWLSQFFAVPFEDENGDYLYSFTQPGYEEMLYYLNDLVTTQSNGHNLISAANFTQNYDTVGSVVASASAFATLVTPQDYQIHFQTAKESGYEYVSLYITNENGDAPVLQDIRGYGYLMNMITTDCKRPDLLIKLFDFLSSDEGQRLICFGVEGSGWEWADEAETKIKFTDRYLTQKSSGKGVSEYGMMTFDLLINYQYYDNVQPQTNNGKTEGELFRVNLKRPLTVYSYDLNATRFIIDATDSRYKDYSTALTRIDSLTGTQVNKILKATSAAEAKSLYEQTVTLLQSRNLALVVEMQNEAFHAAKEKLGITYAWPPRQDGYRNPLDRTQPNGDLTLYRTY